MYGAVRSAGHNVMLGGDMGNSTMSYNGWGLFTELLLSGRWLRLVAEISSSGHRWRRAFRQRVLAPLVPEPLFRRYKRWRHGPNPPWYDFSLIHPEFAAATEVIERAARENDAVTRLLRNNRLARIRELRMYGHTADWYAMVRARFGIDFRHPACHRPLVEFCFGIPEDQYLREGQDRWLIRRAMKGRLPDIVLNQKRFGTQAADWYPRLTRQRNQLAREVKRLAEHPEVASILDMQRLNAILESWPDRQPAEYTPQESQMMAVPDALGAAYFIEDMTGSNYPPVAIRQH
jgi:asparagine synthase (glutamine-hydrolysing)